MFWYLRMIRSTEYFIYDSSKEEADISAILIGISTSVRELLTSRALGLSLSVTWASTSDWAHVEDTAWQG